MTERRREAEDWGKADQGEANLNPTQPNQYNKCPKAPAPRRLPAPLIPARRRGIRARPNGTHSRRDGPSHPGSCLLWQLSRPTFPDAASPDGDVWREGHSLTCGSQSTRRDSRDPGPHQLLVLHAARQDVHSRGEGARNQF